MEWRIGIDVGGTFTDFVAVSDDGRRIVWKEETTPDCLEEGVQRGLQGLSGSLGIRLPNLLAATSLLVHGTTAATNTVIERSGPRLGLVCTRGFRDAVYFRDGFKWNRFDRHLQRPPDFVERALRLPVDERINKHGEVLRPLSEADVRRAGRTLAREGVGAVAVALLWSNVNPTHERSVRNVLANELPDVPVLLSSDVMPELGEWVRTAAVVLAAYVYSSVESYLRGFERWLADQGLSHSPLVMQVNGGCARTDEALRVPVSLIGSGPAAAPSAARALAATGGRPDLIVIDMGGTSFDVCVLQGGDVPLTRQLQVAHQPIGVPGVDVHSIGAGGGSIAWVDSGGALRVGPRSAGARPGPAAYARGGELPTVTDANVVLGYLSPERFLGGRRHLSAESAEQAIRKHVAEPLGLSPIEAAAGIVRIVEANMVSAIRVVSVERGIDPRPFALIAGGGAAGLHAGRLAAALGMDTVLVPSHAAVLSAYGMTVSDIRLDYVAPLYTDSTSPAVSDVARLVKELEERAVKDLNANGFDRSRIRLVRSVDARYVGQVHELITPVPSETVDSTSFRQIERSFAALHAERYSYSLPGTPVEYLHWRLTGIGVIGAVSSAPRAAGPPVGGVANRSRNAYFSELGGFVDTPVFDAASLRTGALVNGPAIVDAETTTVVIPPGYSLRADQEECFELLCGTDKAITKPAFVHSVHYSDSLSIE